MFIEIVLLYPAGSSGGVVGEQLVVVVDSELETLLDTTLDELEADDEAMLDVVEADEETVGPLDIEELDVDSEDAEEVAAVGELLDEEDEDVDEAEALDELLDVVFRFSLEEELFGPWVASTRYAPEKTMTSATSTEASSTVLRATLWFAVTMPYFPGVDGL